MADAADTPRPRKKRKVVYSDEEESSDSSDHDKNRRRKSTGGAKPPNASVADTSAVSIDDVDLSDTGDPQLTEEHKALAADIEAAVRNHNARASTVPTPGQQNVQSIIFCAEHFDAAARDQMALDETRVKKIANGITKRLQALCGDDDGDSSEDEEPEIEINVMNIDDKNDDAAAAPSPADPQRMYKRRLKKLLSELEPRMLQLRQKPTKDQVYASLRLKLRTRTYALRQLVLWAQYVARCDDMQLGEFIPTRLRGYFEYLATLTVRIGPPDRIGKPLEATTITSITVGTFFGLQLTGYIPADERLDARLPDNMKRLHAQVMEHVQAPDPIDYYPLYPIDAVNYVRRLKFDSEFDVQAAAYVLLRSVTALRLSSVLEVPACGSKGIRLGDLAFRLERDGPNGEPNLCATIRITYYKQVKATAAKNYVGEVIKLPGLKNKFADAVQWLFMQCVQLNAFELDVDTMMATGKFPMKKGYENKPLFRLPTSVGTLSERALIHQDRIIMDHFSETMRLPKRKVRGHGFRLGTALMLADRVLDDQAGGNASVSLQAVIKATGIWPGRGYGAYTNRLYKHLLQLPKFLFGQNSVADSLRDVVAERPAAYALSEERYLPDDHPIVIAAVDLCDKVKPRKDAVIKAKEKYYAYAKPLGIPPLEAGIRSAEAKAVFNALTREQREEVVAMAQEIAYASSVLSQSRRKISETYASYGNQLLLERDMEADKKTTGKELYAVVFHDFPSACKQIEAHMRSSACYPYGPFERVSQASMDGLRCYFAECSLDVSAMELHDFLGHLLDQHGIVPYARSDMSHEKAQLISSVKERVQRARDDKGEIEKSKKLKCSKCEKSYSVLADFMRHTRTTHHQELAQRCKTCDTRFKHNRTRLRKHNKSNPHHIVEPIPLPFVDFSKLLLISKLESMTYEEKEQLPLPPSKTRCDDCLAVRKQFNMLRISCIVESGVYETALNGASAMVKSVKSQIEKRCSQLTASQEDTFSVELAFASIICQQLFPDVADIPSPIDFLNERCPCILKNMQNSPNRPM